MGFSEEFKYHYVDWNMVSSQIQKGLFCARRFCILTKLGKQLWRFDLKYSSVNLSCGERVSNLIYLGEKELPHGSLLPSFCMNRYIFGIIVLSCDSLLCFVFGLFIMIKM